MSTCAPHRENLALRAGGDLPQGPDATALQAHLDACGACRDLDGALSSDRILVARAATQPDPELAGVSLVGPVLARAAAEAVADGLYRTPSARPRKDLGLLAFGRVAVAVAVVAAAALLGVSVLFHAPAGHDAPAGEASAVPTARSAEPPQAHAPSAAAAEPVQVAVLAPPAATAHPAPAPATSAPTEFRSVRVHRAGGPAVELEWESDGRETTREGGSGAYRVLASASPSDFSGAKPVLVAGSRLITGSDLPSLRTMDRSLTYFRVE